MREASELRKLFLLRPDIAFLNHGSFGACPQPVFAAYQAWQRELEREPVEFLGRRFEALMAQARADLAHFLGADPPNLVFMPNATTAMNTVARSLPLAPGDEVLSTDHEYGAVDRMWSQICAEKGARYVRAQIPVPVRSTQDIAQAVKAWASSRTRVLSLSHITSPTALLFPVEGLVRWAKERGIMTVIDGAHAPGQIPLALEALGADFYVGNAHKWLMAPKGAAFLHARPEVQPLLKPLAISWGAEIRERPGEAPFVDEHEWQGTRDISAYLAVSAAIEFWKALQLAAGDCPMPSPAGGSPPSVERPGTPARGRTSGALCPANGRFFVPPLRPQGRAENPVDPIWGRSPPHRLERPCPFAPLHPRLQHVG